jgi:hypothetical protein
MVTNGAIRATIDAITSISGRLCFATALANMPLACEDAECPREDSNLRHTV